MKYMLYNSIGLREYEKEMLRDIGCITKYDKNELILDSGVIPETLFLIESGWVRIKRHGAGIGGYAVKSFRRTGDIIGLDSVLFGVKESVISAVALTNTTGVSINKDSFLELLNFNPFFLKRVVGLLCHYVNRIQNDTD